MAEMNCSVATGSVKDNYFDEDCFSSKRYLDSLASLFAVQGNCAAILHSNGKFFFYLMMQKLTKNKNSKVILSSMCQYFYIHKSLVVRASFLLKLKHFEVVINIYDRRSKLRYYARLLNSSYENTTHQICIQDNK